VDPADINAADKLTAILSIASPSSLMARYTGLITGGQATSPPETVNWGENTCQVRVDPQLLIGLEQLTQVAPLFPTK